MQETKEDLRVRRTHKLLSEALIKLLQKKPFEKISVKDICDEAMVHRTTFYSHFQDKYELLAYCVKEFEAPFDTLEVTENSLEGYMQYYVSVAKAILKQVEENKEIFMSFIKKNVHESFITNLQYLTEERIKEKLKKCVESGLEPEIPIELLASFYSGGCLSAATWWLINDMPCTSEEMVKYLDLLIRRVDKK